MSAPITTVLDGQGRVMTMIVGTAEVAARIYTGTTVRAALSEDRIDAAYEPAAPPPQERVFRESEVAAMLDSARVSAEDKERVLDEGRRGELAIVEEIAVR